jgi:AcrR family transcriptional regulator
MTCDWVIVRDQMSDPERFRKSLVHASVEAVLLQKASRFDPVARANRAKAGALIECAEKGYSGLTMAGIAKRAKVSTASLYHDYKDRDNLLVSAIELFLSILANDQIVLPDDPDPYVRVKFLLKAHGQAFEDGFSQWLIRLHINFAWSGHPHLFERGRAIQDRIEETWNALWRQLEVEGYICAPDPQLITDMMLGAIERETIVAGLMFIGQETSITALDDLVEHTAMALFEVWGTQKFWQERAVATGAEVTHPTTEIGPMGTQSLGIAPPRLCCELPSARLDAYALAVNSASFDRLDGKGRKKRVLLAALLECKELGYAAASMAGVAHHAGVSTATLYRDYETKQDLFIDALAQQALQLQDINLFVNPLDSPEQTIANQVYTSGAVLGDPDFAWFHHAMLVTEISNSTTLNDAALKVRTKSDAFWSELIESYVQQGVLRPGDPRLIANLLLGGVQRKALLGLLFFGTAAHDTTAIAALAIGSTEVVFQIYSANSNRGYAA